MLREWVKFAVELSDEPADFYASNRKILRNQSLTFTDFSDPVQLSDAGYTKSKLTMLYRLYFHEESIKIAITLWKRRVEQKQYGSVGFTTYNHFIKNDPNKKSKRASVMGPCIQSVTLTYLNDHTCGIDAFYRTTEVYKKFPADLVFLQEILKLFNFKMCPISQINFHFANVTVHPMYFLTIAPHLKDPIKVLERFKKQDKYFYDWIVKWSSRYLVPEHGRGIQKFAQALRVQKDIMGRIDKQTIRRLIEYLRKNHPGYVRHPEYKPTSDE